MLQDEDYESPLKLYCNDTKFEVIKFGSLENSSYVCRVIENKEKK